MALLFQDHILKFHDFFSTYVLIQVRKVHFWRTDLWPFGLIVTLTFDLKI